MRISFQDISRLVALPHSVFALPFAVSSYLFALRLGSLTASRYPELLRFLLIVVAVVFARTAAMAFNRFIDADIDLKNPRTEGREVPAGRVSKRQAAGLSAGSAVLFLLCTAALGMHCLLLSPFVLAVLFGYSLTKRFSSQSHLVLGLALALAPGGAWWVVRPIVEKPPLLLMTAVLFWVAGFDILYSCQDVIFDRKSGLYSIPAEVGVERALHLSVLSHVLSFVCFLAVGHLLSLGGLYWLGMCLFGAVLIGQHALLRPHDLGRVNQAFFVANGTLSILYLFLAMIAFFTPLSA